MFKKLLIITLILSLLFIPVLAETENIIYDTGYQFGYADVYDGGATIQGSNLLQLKFTDVQAWIGITAGIYYLPYNGKWEVRDIDIHTSEVPVIYKISGEQVGTGTLQFIRHINADEELSGGQLSLFFSDGINTDALEAQNLLCEFNEADFNFRMIYNTNEGGGVTSQTKECPYLIDGRSKPRKSNGNAYKRGVFDITYIYNLDNNVMDFSLNRKNVISYIKLIDNNSNPVLEDITSNNLYIDNLINTPYILNITNPQYIGTGPHKYYERQLPWEGEEPTEPPGENIILQWGAYNASLGGNRIEVDYILNAKINNEWIEQSSGINPYYIDSELPSNAVCQIILSQTNYETNTIEFNTPNYNILKNFPLYPDYGNNYSVIFQIENQDGYLLEDVKVDLNGEIKYTPWNGKVEFKNIASPITYKITKSGYSAIIKIIELTKSQQINIELNALPEDELAVLSWYAYNAESSNEVIGVTYNLSIKNQITNNWEIQTTGYNPSYLDLSIPKNSQYRINLTSPGYNSYSEIFDIIHAQTAKNFPMYHDYGSNFSVVFRIEDSDGKRLESVKINCDNQIKYTPYNGIIGFGDVSPTFNYEISKTGYISLSGSKTITFNQELYIILFTEEESLPTTVPTEPIPDIEHPTNLLESIKYSFQKIFGLTGFEDTETINLIIGLILILGCTCLIAKISHNALGAVVGGLIGFVMALALGFIPLWILFVAFAGFTIYIILTKTGGE